MISTNGTKSINSLISLNECTGLNLEGWEAVREIFGYGGTLKSNKGDPEVILIIKFRDNVNISGIFIEGSMDKSQLPTNMQLFVNNSTVDFSDIGSINPTESLKVESGKTQTLKIAKFRNVSILSIYFTNPDADQIQINNIQFFGSESDKMDFSQIKKVNP